MNNSSFPLILLAGGLATRLRPMTETLPKSLIKIAGEPFIFHQLRLLKQYDIHHVIICIGYLGELIKKTLGNGHTLGMHIDYSEDGETLLGTGGAIKKALHFVKDHFYVLYGDSYLPFNYQEAKLYYLQQKKLALMTIFKNNNQGDISNVNYNDHQILSYNKHFPTDNMNYIDYGLGLFHKCVFDAIPLNTQTDLATIYENLLNNHQLAAYEVKERFYEVGSWKGIKELETYLSR